MRFVAPVEEHHRKFWGGLLNLDILQLVANKAHQFARVLRGNSPLVLLPEFCDGARERLDEVSERVLLLRQGRSLAVAVARDPLRRLDRIRDDFIRVRRVEAPEGFSTILFRHFELNENTRALALAHAIDTVGKTADFQAQPKREL